MRCGWILTLVLRCPRRRRVEEALKAAFNTSTVALNSNVEPNGPGFPLVVVRDCMQSRII